MAVNLRKKYIGDSKLSARNRPYKFQLDYLVNGKRIRETIKEVEFKPSDTKEERKEKERIVNRIKAKLEIELGNSKNGLVSRQLQKANFIEYFKKLGDSKTDNTKTTWDNTYKHLISFQGRKIKFEDVSPNWLQKFIEHLNDEVSNNSTFTYFNKVNAALNKAVKEKIILENPAIHIDRPKKEENEMVYLTEKEIQEIINTDFFDKDVKNAFLFGCYTGLRFSDISNLKWKNITEEGIQLKQTKTKSTVYIPLNENSRNILESQKKDSEFVFNLSNYNSSSNRTLKKLIDVTSIDKDVSFHTARHTFATLLITHGVNIYTVSKLLGHKDINSTLVYAKVVNEEKEKAVNSIPTFNF
ncbi:tyrosine-type recombinase/integrase [Mangrovimonas sp. CR14]|uniref:tyrosine-type recombinase/integrase n=1 Tax=Mangrovimonas sp. CR14 TaxID=2706120 RepID=UPI00141F639F|nr:tyrosine-type recombinase/integrase [Mangrovimonas sp. CR14]NIK91165.1 tyrosine-type recombinase/integrase [Mangrovimonas sp. CR14]